MADFLLIGLFSSLLLHVACNNAFAALPSFDALYQFGDSIADTGNTNYCRNPPYGETFFQHPTGRCSDGLLMIDYFAEALGLPFLSPYLDEYGNFTHGVNFAVAGATALDVFTLASKNIHRVTTGSSLSVQLDWFKSHLNKTYATPSASKEKMEKALVFVGEFGGNDYSFAECSGFTMEDLHNMVPEVVQTIMDSVREVIHLGAKRIIVPGNFPTGCLTITLAKYRSTDPTMYDELNCLKKWNEFAVFHNEKLQYAINEVQKEHHDVAIVYADYFSAMRSILKDAPSLGFDEVEVLKACCGTGDEDYNIDPTRMCGSYGTLVCEDSNKRISWDGIHFTQHSYQLMANWLLPYIIPTTVQVLLLSMQDLHKMTQMS